MIVLNLFKQPLQFFELMLELSLNLCLSRCTGSLLLSNDSYLSLLAFN